MTASTRAFLQLPLTTLLVVLALSVSASAQNSNDDEELTTKPPVAAKSEKTESQSKTDSPAGDEKVTLSEQEQKFADMLTNAALVGRFTMDGQDLSSTREEAYEIESATKLNNDDYWTILARIKYGKYDLKVPVTLKVLWAGDTPVMSLTDLTIPLMGTFTARVMFYDNRYVGTWQHGEKGGHMLGYVKKMKPAKTAPSGK